LYFTILRYQGYIYYWDLSGAFDFRDPFGQYFKLFTSWDASNVGVRNRLPLVSLIYLIYLPFKLLGVSPEVVVKIAITLLFLGGYTIMYFLAPKLVRLFCKQDINSQGGIYFWALVASLLYSFIPFYTYRFSQLDLFYMSIFYPLQVYLFLRLTNASRFDWKGIVLFVLSMFFGLTTPNIIIFDLLTFAIFFLFKVIFSIKNIKTIITPILNILSAMILVILTNLYWLVPYFLSGSPEPGYVVNTSMVQLLSQGTTVVNFLLGQADWFVNQASLGVLDTSSPIYVIQILGCVVFYVVGIFGLVRHIKKEYILPFLILLLIAPVIVLDIFPFHDSLFNSLVYSSFGWIFREVNRISFLWFFWFFVLFILGAYSIFESILLEGKLNHLLKVIVLPAIFIPYIIYIFPVNAKFFSYLKPVKIDTSIQQVYDLLDSDKDYFSVYYYPQLDPYSIPWLTNKFDIADSEEYKLLAYNSPKPSVDISSVIPNGKDEQGLLTDYLFEQMDILPNFANTLNSIGVKYLVIEKNVEPITLDEEYVTQKILQPVYSYLTGSKDFTKVLENDNYAVFKNIKFGSIVGNKENSVYTYESFNILEHLDSSILSNYDIRFCGFAENVDDCKNGENTNTYLRYEGDTNYFINFLTKEQQEAYGYYPYDFVQDHAIGVDWGRASFTDKINGELHNVFRNYDIHAWSSNIVDKVVYSDLPFEKTVQDANSTYVSTLSFTQKSKCNGTCEVFAYVLYNHIGGSLEIDVNNQHTVLNTNSTFEEYKWVDLGSIPLNSNTDIQFVIKNSKGFSSIGGILVLPSNVLGDLQSKVSAVNIIDVPYKGVLYSNSVNIYNNNCKITTSNYQTGLIPKLTVKTNCLTSSDLYIKNYSSQYLLSPSNGNILTTSLFGNVQIYNQSVDIWFLGSDNLTSLTLCILGFLVVGVLLVLY
jgi:hypothetical protein